MPTIYICCRATKERDKDRQESKDWSFDSWRDGVPIDAIAKYGILNKKYGVARYSINLRPP
jgi:hypothetical protein